MTDGDRREYLRKYYKENRDRMREARRKRYEEDAAYREAVLTRARERRLAERLQSGDAIDAGTVPPPGRIPSNQVLFANVNGRQIGGYPQVALAERLLVSVSTIRRWRQRGILPDTPYRVGKLPIYTDAMMDVVVQAMAHWDGTADGGPEFYRMVKRGWTVLGCYVQPKNG